MHWWTWLIIGLLLFMVAAGGFFVWLAWALAKTFTGRTTI